MFAEDIEKVAEEPILFAVIGEMCWGQHNLDLIPRYNEQPKGKLLAWSEAKKWLSYTAYDGYVAPTRNPVYCWTENYILFISKYDGKTSIEKIPRNPVDWMPEMPGG